MCFLFFASWRTNFKSKNHRTSNPYTIFHSSSVSFKFSLRPTWDRNSHFGYYLSIFKYVEMLWDSKACMCFVSEVNNFIPPLVCIPVPAPELPAEKILTGMLREARERDAALQLHKQASKYKKKSHTVHHSEGHNFPQPHFVVEPIKC